MKSACVFLLLACFALAQLCCAYDVVVLSDTHYDSRKLRPDLQTLTPEISRNFDAWEKRMPQYLEFYRKLVAKKAAFVIHCGDLAQGRFSTTDDKTEIQVVKLGIDTFAQKIPVKFFCVKGNHETYCVNPEQSSDKVILQHLRKNGIHPHGLNYAFEHKNDLFLFFDCNKPDLEYVKQTLEKHPAVKRTFFITHLPLLPCSSAQPGWLIFGKEGQQTKYRELVNLLAKRDAIVICGHVHITTLIEARFTEGRIRQITVFSLPEASNGNVRVAQYPQDSYFTKIMKTSGPRVVPANLLEFLKGHYSFFNQYYPSAGVHLLRIKSNRIEMIHYGISGEQLHSFAID